MDVERAKFKATVEIRSVTLVCAEGDETVVGRAADGLAFNFPDGGKLRPIDVVNQFHRQIGKSVASAGGDIVMSNAAKHGSATYTSTVRHSFDVPQLVQEVGKADRHLTGLKVEYLVTVSRALDG